MTEPEVRDVADDPASIEVRFALPRGSYATVVLREVMKSDLPAAPEIPAAEDG